MEYTIKFKFKWNLWLLILLVLQKTSGSEVGSQVDFNETVECPIGFNVTNQPNGEFCIQVKTKETYNSKYDKCNGNLVPINFFDRKLNLFIMRGRRFWTDYVRAYESGPFINWRLGDENMGVPLLNVNIWDESSSKGSDMCASVDLITKTIKPSNCNERYSRICMINTYSNSEPIVWGNCSYLSFSDPVPSCLIPPSSSSTSRKVPVRAKFPQCNDYCLRKNSHMLHRGYIYSNHPELSGQNTWELPLGIQVNNNNLYWMDYDDEDELIPVSEWNFAANQSINPNFTQYVSLKNEKWMLRDQSHVFQNLICEQFVELPYIEIEVVSNGPNQLLVVTKIDPSYNNFVSISDIWCFTDSVRYFPIRVNISETGQRGVFSIKPIKDGYYWCLNINTKLYKSREPKKTLHIKDHNEAKDKHAIMVQFHNDAAFSLTERFIENVGQELNEYFDLYYFGAKVSKLRVKRVYDGRRILFHGIINSAGPYETTALKSLSIVYIRNVLACFRIGELPESSIGDAHTSDDNCVKSKCLGDFNIGAYWKNELTLSSSCTTTPPPSTFSTTEPNTTITPTTEEPITWLPSTTTEPTTTTELTTTTTKEPTTTVPPIVTTLSPTDQVNEVANNIQNIANGTVNSTQLVDATNQINSILAIQDDVAIPQTIIMDIEVITSKMTLNDDENFVKVIEPNIAVVVSDVAKDSQIYGIKIDNDEAGFTDDSVELLTNNGRPTPVSNKTDLIVKIPPSFGLNNDSRMSFVVFRNDKAFDQETPRHIQRVNSRIISISISNMTTFVEGQYIDILLRPHEELQNEESKQCAYWDFNAGPKGNWSTKGCMLLPEKSPDGLDICRCFHLTHFAEIIRHGKKEFSNLNYQILSLISIVGCTLSLIGLFLIGLTGCMFKSWRADFSNKIWMHLSASIALLMILFVLIFFVNFNKDNKIFCVATGALLHYSVLASFLWMLISAVLSYRRLVTVFAKNSSHRLLKACVLGWIVPVIPIGILFGVDPDNYSSRMKLESMQSHFCYPSGLGFWLTVVLPVGIIVLANLILFSIIIYSVFISSKIKRHGDSKQLFRSISVSFLLFFLFGLTWIFGLLSEELVFSYLFCMTATLQGLILFLFFIVGNKKTRELWMIKLRLKEKKKIPVTSTMSRSYGGRPATTTTSMSNGKRSFMHRYDEPYVNKPRSLSGMYDNCERFS